MNPYLIQPPACISFSGGRTSGYMLRRILDAHGGSLPFDVYVLFANTGKERPETLDFVRDCEEHWDVPIRWVEYELTEGKGELIHGWREVHHKTASRNGEPFSALIRARSFLPNPVMRFCTQELKIRVMRKFARAVGFDYWTSVIGLRADEPARVARATAPTSERWENTCPLAEAGETLADVTAFWKAQPFDLRLRPDEGNCDLCYLKGRGKLQRIMREHPELAGWWIEQEDGEGSDRTFRKDRPTYRRMLEIVKQTPLLNIDLDDNGTLPCACTD